MSNEIIRKAKEYYQAGLSVLPLNNDKSPATTPTWKPLQDKALVEEEIDKLFNLKLIRPEIITEIENEKTKEIKRVSGIITYNKPPYLGIICGKVSGNLEVIDVDCKYDVTGELWVNLKNLILLEDSLSGLFDELLIAKTVNKGYHLFYKCEEIEGNQKLAFNVEGKCIIETRGEGGYVAAYPSTGYEFIQGSVDEIPTITPLQRKKLFEITDSLSYVEPTIEEEEVVTRGEATIGLSCWDDYNSRTTTADVLDLLKAHNWSEVKTDKGGRVYVLRPANGEPSTAKYSGNINRIKKGDKEISLFSVFTDNGAPFTENVMRDGKPVKDEKGRFKKQAYTPFKIYTLLEHNGDNSKAAKELYKLGYGERLSKTDSQEKTELIKVEVVNRVTGEISVISNPGDSLKIENIQTAIGEEIVITSPGSEAQEEILKAIDLILQTGKRIYIKEGATEEREYSYQLRFIFNKYGAIQEESGGLTHRDRDSLLDEVVILSTKLQPIDKDVFLKALIDLPAIKELGISEEAIAVTRERITTTRDKEAQAKSLQELIRKVKEHQEKGETDKALELLESKVKEVRLKDKATEFSSLLLPTSEALVKKAEEIKPKDLETGYTINGEDFLLPGGAITVFAGATGHGKTILSINTALNVAQRYPDKKFIFFTYEERDTAILQYFLNTYIDKELNSSTSPKSNRRLIKEYFKTGSTQYIARENIAYFESKKEEFFTTYIETGRILVKYVDFNSKELDLAIRYLHKTEPNIGGVFIDYFQLLNLPGELKRAERINSRQEELKEICQSLKRVAIDTGLPLILGAQFNRDVTDLTKLHPTKIGEAGDIERIVNTLVGLWDVSKNIVGKETSKGEESEIKKRTGDATTGMYVELLKSRDLATGIYELLDYNGKTGKIKNSSSSGSNHFR